MEFSHDQNPDSVGLLVYESIHSNADQSPFFSIYEISGDYLVDYPDIGFFQLDKHSGDLTVEQPIAGAEEEFEAIRRGAIAALAAEIAGDPTLHASAVVIGEESVLFAGLPRAGKTTLATMFAQAGFQFITDDLARIGHDGKSFRIYPSEPSIKLWPKNADYFFGHSSFPTVYPGTSKKLISSDDWDGIRLEANPVQIQRVYLIERSEAIAATEIEFSDLLPHNALVALNRHSYMLRVATALGVQKKRLEFLSEFVSNTIVKTIKYPSGYIHFQKIREAIVEDCGRKT